MNDVKTAITPRREQDYPNWYQEVVREADLAENSDVRGCMVIKPWGYGIWENIQRSLDRMFKATGHKNAYFPLFIPISYLAKEAEHVEGFAKECAVVTHHRLEKAPGGGLRPAPSAELSEPLVVRPTSETIIGASFAKWVKSYRDLPILINQWCNVVRWEMRTRVFLRTAEFLWQEGHTAHETEAEAREETEKMLKVYAEFAQDFMAVPVFMGEKTEGERFPGAVQTLCIEAMMQDRKALQAGTSHFLGQNFAKGSGIRFLSRDNKEEFAWTSSWGVSTRLIGALIMVHADDDGMIMPPRLAPAHVVILPITPKPDTREAVLKAARELAEKIRDQSYDRRGIEVEVDERDLPGGQKSWEWIKKGIPLRIEIGPRDLEKGSVALYRRDQGPKDKTFPIAADLPASLPALLQDIQDGLYEKALALREQHTVEIDNEKDFYAFFTPKNADKPEIHGGFALAHFSGSTEVEERLKNELKVTVRCIPRDLPVAPGKCIFTGEPSKQRVIFAKAY